MISLKHIAQSTLKLVDERFRVSSDQNWNELVTVLMEETNFYKAIQAISASGNWPMRSNEFELWQTYFFMELAEYCHRTKNLSVEGKMIEHPTFMELLEFIQSLKKVTRLRGQEDLIDELIKDPLAEVNFKDQLIEHLIRRQKREELQDLMDLWEAETRHDSTLLTPENADILDLDMHDTLDIGGEEDKKQPAMPKKSPLSEHTPIELNWKAAPAINPGPEPVASRKAKSIFEEAKKLERTGKPQLALKHYYYCRQELKRQPEMSRSLNADCATAIARCTAKVDLARQHHASVHYSDLEQSGNGRTSRVIQRVLWALVLGLIAFIGWRVYVVYQAEIMEYLGYFFQAKGRLFLSN